MHILGTINPFLPLLFTLPHPDHSLGTDFLFLSIPVANNSCPNVTQTQQHMSSDEGRAPLSLFLTEKRTDNHKRSYNRPLLLSLLKMGTLQLFQRNVSSALWEEKANVKPQLTRFITPEYSLHLKSNKFRSNLP